MLNEKVIQFSEGVVFSFPAGLINCHVHKKGIGEIECNSEEWRPVIRVKLFVVENDSITEMIDLRDKFMLRVYFLGKDIEKWEDDWRKKLKLGVCLKNKWVILNDKEGFKWGDDDEPGFAGYAEVWISGWSDPVIAWGQ